MQLIRIKMKTKMEINSRKYGINRLGTDTDTNMVDI